MKYLIFITTLIISTASFSMEKYFYQMSCNSIEKKSKGKPSITLINKTGILLSMRVGNLEKDEIRSTMDLRKDTELTFSPYGSSFCLKEKYLEEGTIINLTTHTPKQFSYDLNIGGKSDIKFGDTVQLNYDGKNINIVRNPNDQLKFKRTNRKLKLSREKIIVPKRSSTFS